MQLVSSKHAETISQDRIILLMYSSYKLVKSKAFNNDHRFSYVLTYIDLLCMYMPFY